MVEIWLLALSTLAVVTCLALAIYLARSCDIVDFEIYNIKLRAQRYSPRSDGCLSEGERATPAAAPPPTGPPPLSAGQA